jgi:RNA polymerase sigma-70 factor (ECF subfamily)
MEANFHAYIFTVAKNLTLNYIKKHKRTQLFSHFGSKNPENYLYSDNKSQQKTLEEKINEQQLISALKTLKENQRIALILKVYMDFSYKKIAKITGWSISKIETLISRAKRELKNKIFLQEN